MLNEPEGLLKPPPPVVFLLAAFGVLILLLDNLFSLRGAQRRESWFGSSALSKEHLSKEDMESVRTGEPPAVLISPILS